MGFHVPRVTIKVDFEKGASFGELSLISLGYGLHQAWIYSSMFDKGGIFGADHLAAIPFNEQLSLAYFVSILVYGLLLLTASIVDTRLIRMLYSNVALGTAAALGAAGTLLLLPDPALSSPDLLQTISGVLTGLGSSVLLLAWGAAFSRADSASIIINGALSIAIGFGVYGLFLHQIPHPWGGVASAAIPLVECGLLLVLNRHVSRDFDNRRLIFQPLPINHARFVLRFGVPVFFLGVALGIIRQTSIASILPGSVFEDQAMLFFTACCATVLIMITFLALGGNERWHTLFRPLIPLIALTAVLIPFTSDGSEVWSTSIVLVGYMSFEALMWIFFAELAQRFRISPIFVFGLGRGTMALAALGGSVLPLFTDTFGLSDAFGSAGTVLIVILAMMIAYVMLPDEREMAAIVAVDPRRAAAVHNIPRTPLILVNEGSAATDAAQGIDDGDEEEPRRIVAVAAPALALEDAGRQGTPEAAGAAVATWAEGASSDGAAGRPAEEQPGEGAGAARAADGDLATATDVGAADAGACAAAAAGAAAAAAAVSDAATTASGECAASLSSAPAAPAAAEAPAAEAPAASRPAMDFSRSIFAEEAPSEPVPAASADDSPAARGRFRERCEVVANTYLLSRRENEVMYYLARGYKSSFIQQQLYISEGTAKTHIRHIYRKLNIHSQQELIHLIDEVEL